MSTSTDSQYFDEISTDITNIFVHGYSKDGEVDFVCLLIILSYIQMHVQIERQLALASSHPSRGTAK